MTFDITQIIQSVLTILVVVITGIVIPAIKSHTTAEQRSTVEAMIKTLVYAAEQLADTGVITLPKKEWVLQEINTWLKDSNISFNVEEVNAMIEAAVRELNINQGAIKSV